MKIKNVFSAGKMNKDVDERLIQKGEFIEGYNIRVLNTSGSDAGAIENEKGNLQLTNIPATSSPVCIGAVSDDAEEKIYWFVVNSLGHSFIYEYDVVNRMTVTVLADIRPSATQVLNFNSGYKITGANVIYNTSKKEKLLLFTDGLNSPKMVNINRAKTYGTNGFDEDDISLYKKPPRFAPSISPFQTANESENSLREKFFSFAYRYRYLDGGYSAPSSFTYFQFSPKQFELEWAEMKNVGMENIFNGYNIQYNTGDHRVTDIQLLFKYPTETTLFLIDNINKKETGLPNNSTETYEFVNKKIYKTLPPDEVFRLFDDVPLTAKAQDFIDDRLIFGNTSSQYDLLKNAEDEAKIKIDYNVNYTSSSIIDNTIIGFIVPGSEEEIRFNLDGYQLKKGALITFYINLFSNEVTVGPDTYWGGTAEIQSAFVLSQNYGSVIDMVASTEFINCLNSLTNIFESVVQTTSPPDTDLVTYGSFTLLPGTTNTTFKLSAPGIDHRVDNTPLDPNDSDFTTLTEQFLFEDSSFLSYNQFSSNRSLKSNRSYEVGIVYLDEYGRHSSVLLPYSNVNSERSEVFIPIANSVDINKIQIQVNNPAPYWADRYKFFVKTNKALHYNLYGTIIYEDGLDRYVLLEGCNNGKVEKGQTLIVKSDNDGPIFDEVKVTVLEVVTKTAADSETAGDGWIPGNQDFNGNPLNESPGVYMKIRVNNFKMDYDPSNFITYKESLGVGFGAESDPMTFMLIAPQNRNHSQSGGTGTTDFGLLQLKDPTLTEPQVYVDQTLYAGSKIKFKFTYSESDGNPSYSFEKEWYVNNTYTTDPGTKHALEKFFDAETNGYAKTVIGSGPSIFYPNISVFAPFQNMVQYRFVSAQTTAKHFDFQIFYEPHEARWNVRVITNEGVALLESGTIRARVDIYVNPGTVIFETDPIEVDDDVYWETEETFEISGGYHLGNVQDQDASNSAIVSLDFGNCFSFGNGVESVRVFDDRFKPEYDIKSRPNISIVEGYEKRLDKNRLVYSGPFSEETGYNTLNEFNTSRGISKYLDVKYGGIQKIFARERDLIVFQEDRVSKVLFEKNILTSPDGTGSITQIEKVLGQDVPYAGEYGIALNPESFASYEGRMYFTDANRGAVLSINEQGITPISYMGMKAFFKGFLQGNKNKFNYGGFDPRNHQYVLTMSDDSLPAEDFSISCGTTFTKEVTASYTYSFDIANYPGTIDLDYTTSDEISISIVYNGTLYENNNLTGSGSVSFAVTQGDLDVDRSADITIVPSGDSATVTLTHDCPIPEIMDVVILVVNDEDDIDETIINRHKVGADGLFKSELDVFVGEGVSGLAKTLVTRFETITGEMGTGYIPDNGDVVVVQSFKNPNYHTGEFVNGANRLGYYVSNTPGLTASQIRANATYPSITLTTDPNGSELYSMNFTFNRTLADEKLYLVYDYIG